jgi:hypothetical protein
MKEWKKYFLKNFVDGSMPNPEKRKRIIARCPETCFNMTENAGTYRFKDPEEVPKDFGIRPALVRSALRSGPGIADSRITMLQTISFPTH